MAICTLGIGPRECHMAKEATSIKMEQRSKAIGYVTSIMGREERSGPMEPSLRELTRTVRRMDMDALSGLMVASLRATFSITRWMAMVFTYGLTDASMMDSGNKTSSTDKVASSGATGGNTVADTLMINEKASGSFAGRMGESMQEAGIWENSTV